MSDSPILLPPSTIGILGGGQLGRMLTLEARRMGYRVAVFTDEKPGCPAGQWADAEYNAAYDDKHALERFLSRVDVVTVEFENIPDACLQAVEAVRPLRPGRKAIHTTQHREREKLFLRDQGIACAPFRIVETLAQLEEAVKELGRPCVIKTAAFGYDGKGQAKVNADTDLAEAWKAFEGHHAVVEQWIPFVAEVSVVGARSVDGRMAVHGVLENQHAHHILDVTIAPARVEVSITDQALELWEAVAEGLDYVGTMAVEMFVTADGKVMVNEIAPRPHNSGHYSIDACVTNQFQQQLRAICGLSLGDPSLHTPAVMINLLGDVWPAEKTPPDWSAVLMHPRAKLHLYGKAEARAKRKMGHITVLGDTVEEALESAQSIKTGLGMA
ncbi:5-(carboxyamino)imidazole ribonucleotide synthase [Brevifollis gellanilyticus]|uniref:N5-carboxyaminoimidazole ribonucleotide synthase n=1 Tax=Brevifollis gellanilyticus TaxID=748831 RepID=A0A512M4H8_9BACT|nr:5-(carboxyamino)imidazole ribonucleotide synthase [Brevifollis gellanilyticus]GEP41646.1 N5-carboxyaminoimidazole ribonucleotide synthase [Brevifollis gellanilyticus]